MPPDRIGKTRQKGLLPLSTSPRGVLHRLPVGEFDHQRLAPPEDLADWIEHIWRVRWNLEGLPPQLQETLPHPNIHLVLEPSMAAFWGVHSRRWSRELSARSLALGIKFRPGAFRPWLGGPVSALSDRSLALQELFGPEAQALSAALEIDALAEAATPVLDFLRARLPAPDPQALLAGRIVDSVAADLSLHSAEVLAARWSLSLRSLQRLFSEYVGVGPKWVIQCYRMHEAVARVQAGETISWAALAQDLGFFDQAHFSAAFRRLIGQTPGSYSKAMR
ncbi:helix-turn-helix domain-containing protein [Paucibacter sp. DJ1R-11]|uniref:helix-turn-helix domain-containing protein n=1 Tax=Paucibacter sp. DJ1R-11 TaxID=2893556 RepID=UPI0021E49A12|nr:helix-turn-helix domain-containing protein [Paucibacter sp. DJ1R-11]MCV2361937.1 helix-turn-helix domain-containing protein [Paucibacter sp. DJ1R-11]